MSSIEQAKQKLDDLKSKRTEDKQKVFVIGVEDIILDRLRACVHWKSSSDCEWGMNPF
ncbi:hypothetical protein [Shouchella shacheensis]|uniref:hypothetical protein n=1 Tax=Shouchella shacheensis TaxID=1649580 RepID=UPI000A4D5342|nr:hypothetical protein [Shouchella shacheensis]